MKAVKRKFLVVDENIILSKKDYFQVVRYFNPSHFDLDVKLIIHFDYSESLGAKDINIVARYIENSKSMESYEPLEFFDEFKLSFPEGGITNQNELSISLKLKEDTKLLWKIGIQIFPKHETLRHLSITYSTHNENTIQTRTNLLFKAQTKRKKF